MDGYTDGLWLVRLVFQRGLAAIYLVAFLTAFQQFPALLGERGLLPIRTYIEGLSFLESPSLFFWRSSDRFVRAVAALGIAISVAALLGLPERGPFIVSAATWLVLAFLYVSFVNVGQTFYAFGWESMLVEAGFFAAFLGPSRSEPSLIPILVLRWILFRTELGAGLIKLRHDACWRQLTCLYYHYETQPLPNPLSRLFHRFPKPLHRFSVAFSHFVQLVVPFGLFAPQPVAAIAAGFAVLHQLLLIISGNYSWLNWLTVVLAVSATSDAVLRVVLPLTPPHLEPRSMEHDAILLMLAGAVLVMSIRPALNFFSKNQLMNYSFNPLHLVNAYGAFGSVTKTRYEVILEGTTDDVVSEKSEWKEYEFKAKPGPIYRRPPQIAPYHLRLDWLMWFLPFSVHVSIDGRSLRTRGYEPWFLMFVEKLLQNDRPTLALLRRHPFTDRAPRHIRAQYYRYRFTTREERKQTGAYWERTLIGEYLPPLSASDFTMR